MRAPMHRRGEWYAAQAGFTRRLFAGALGLGLFAGRNDAEAQTPEAAPSGSWTFTDDRGVTVSVPQTPQKIAAVVHDAAALWDYGVRPFAVFGPQRLADGSPDPQVGAVDLNAVTSLGQTWEDFDVEQLLALQVDLVVSHYYDDPVDLWYLPADKLGIVESRVATLGFDYQRGPVDMVIARLAELAGALGADLASPRNGAAKAAFDEAEAELREAIASNPELTVLFIDPYPENFYVANPTIAADLIYLRDLGLDIIVPEGDGFFTELSWEQTNTFPADLILTDTRGQALTTGELDGIATWRNLPAVRAGQVGPWQVGAILSYQSYAAVLHELAAVIRDARADIV